MRWFALAVLALLGGCSSSTAEPTAQGVSGEISAEGAVSVVHRLWASGAYRHVLDGVSSGDQDWIALSPALASGADAASAEGLGIALARALPKNPAAVLAALQPDRRAISVDRVCGIPFIEGDPVDVPAYRRTAIEAVNRVDAVSLRDVRVACLKALKQP